MMGNVESVIYEYWVKGLQQYAAGRADALDLWRSIASLATDKLATPYLPAHESDLQSAEEAQATYAQCDELDALLRRYFEGELPAETLAEEALEILGLDEPGALDG